MMTIESPELKFIIAVLKWTQTSRFLAFNNPINVPELVHRETIRWDFFYTMVLRHRVWHQVLAALTAEGSVIELPIYSRLVKKCKADTFFLLTITAETLRLAQRFTQEKIHHCFIKGVILNEQLYGAIDARPCRDIDVWVDSTGYTLAIDVLLDLGYEKKSPTYELSGFKQHYYMAHFHDMTFVHPTQGLLVELHFSLSHTGLHFYSPTVERCQPMLLCNTAIRTLHDDYHLLYLIVHGANHGWVRLRWLNDIALYILSNQCSLEHVMWLAQEIQCEHLVEQALILVHDCFGIEHHFIQMILQRPHRRAHWLVTAAKRFINKDTEVMFAPVLSSDFFHYRRYCANIVVPKYKMRALWRDLFKIDNLFPYVTFPKKLSFMYYFLYPAWVVRYILCNHRLNNRSPSATHRKPGA